MHLPEGPDDPPAVVSEVELQIKTLADLLLKA